MKRILLIGYLIILGFSLLQLSGCSSIPHKHTDLEQRYDQEYDSAPHNRDIDASKICDAKPRHEPYHPYGAKDYVVRGRKYRVLKDHRGYVKKGYASWYGTKFHGKHTSIQETYDLYGMTAASTELPLPSYAKVTNLQNGRTVIVRVNDHGPFHSKRIIDLSYAAAKKLDFAEKGIAQVKVEAIDALKWNRNKKNRVKSAVIYASNKKQDSNLAQSVQSEMSEVTNPIFLQLGAFSQLANAEQLFEKANQVTDKPIHIEHKDSLYRVHIGPLASAAQTDELKQLLENEGFEQVTVIGG